MNFLLIISLLCIISIFYSTFRLGTNSADNVLCFFSIAVIVLVLCYSFMQVYNNNQLTSECAAMTIWINKHCFNGLYRVNKKGLFNVPFNNKNSGKSMDEENLRKIGEFLNESNAEILEGDFEKACETVEIGDFVYFDSPYVPVNETANFTDYTKDGFTYEDHKRLSELFKSLDKKGVKIMLSNHDVQLVHDLYAGYNIENISVRRHINSDASKRTGKEVIITNYRK